jgi:molybdenum cofactor cytidylyltransferase
MHTAVIILAGGQAERMQQPKMLLPFGDKTLLQILLDETLQLESSITYLVTGYYHQQIAEQVNSDVQLVYNELWPEGMASSIKKGVAAAMEAQPEVQNIVIAVSDQPFLDAELLRNLIRTRQKTGKGIVASEYGDILGTPVLFTAKYIDILFGLSGDMGARTILKAFANDVAAFPFPEGSMDIDTPDDYRKILSAYLAKRC